MVRKYIVFILFLLVSIQLAAAEKTHFTIAIDPEYIPFTQKDIDNNPTGLLVDFWNLWAQKNGYTVSYKFYPWEETLRATKRGDVDFHSGTTNDREWMHVSDTIYELRTALFTLSDASLNTTLDFTNKRIGTIDTYYGSLVENAVGNTVEIVVYDEYEPMVEALKIGEIDALIDDVEAMRYYFIKTGQMNRFKLVTNKQLQFTNRIFAVTNSQNSGLIKLINAGLKKMDLVDLVKLERIWLPRIDEAFYNRKLSQHIEYTDKEKEWIISQGKLTVTGDPVWIQYPDINDHYKYRGVVGDYIQSIAKKMHVDFELLPVESWAEVLVAPENENADIVFGTMNEEIKKLLEEHYTFLTPYEAGPLVIIMNKNIRFVTDLYDVKDKRIGILSLQNYTKPIEFKYADYQFFHYGKVHILLDELIRHKVDAAILPLPDAILALVNKKYQNIDIVGKVDEKAYVNIGVIDTKPMLKNIVKKALQATTVHYRQDILAKWTQKLNYVEKIDYDLAYKVGVLFSIMVFILGYYTYVLKRRHRHEQKINAKIQEVARTDDLTGLHNKRAFNQNFENGHDDKNTIGLLFIDVDHFKSYNDRYGHMEGDLALKTIAEMIGSFVSTSRHPYRIGGEEFGMILYNHTEDEALRLAQKLCKVVERLNIVHEKSPYRYITVSIGIAVADPSIDRYTLYLKADKALYTAKALGRNTVFVYIDKDEILKEAYSDVLS